MRLPKLTAVIEKEGKWYVATCPELGVASQGQSMQEAEAMIQEAVELLLAEADETEIRRRLNREVKVKKLELAHAWVKGTFREPGVQDFAEARIQAYLSGWEPYHHAERDE